MVLNKNDFAAIDKAAAEYFKYNKISTKCPRCGSNMKYVGTNNSYEIRCEKDNCISETFRGI